MRSLCLGRAGAADHARRSDRRSVPRAIKPVDRTPVQTGPAWEKARRYEAYPTIKTRTGMPDIPRVALLAGALGIAALALFFLPALLGMGEDGGSGPSASPSASVAVATASPSPTTAPAPTPQVYVVVGGDTLTKIAKKFDVTVERAHGSEPEYQGPQQDRRRRRDHHPRAGAG